MEPEELVVQKGHHNAILYSSDHRDPYDNNLFVGDSEIQFLTYTSRCGGALSLSSSLPPHSTSTWWSKVKRTCGFQDTWNRWRRKFLRNWKNLSRLMKQARMWCGQRIIEERSPQHGSGWPWSLCCLRPPRYWKRRASPTLTPLLSPQSPRAPSTPTQPMPITAVITPNLSDVNNDHMRILMRILKTLSTPIKTGLRGSRGWGMIKFETTAVITNLLRRSQWP